MALTRDVFMDAGYRLQWVVAIDGYKYLLTDGDTDAALAAWTGTDWTLALDGLFVECRPSQIGNPNDPFANTGGNCVLYVKSYPDQSLDTFGIDVFRRGGGAWTTLGETIDRDDTALVLKNNTSFAAGPADAHIGVECVEYSGTTSSSMTVTTRGKYTAVGTAASGSGGDRFADHHRVALDQNQVLSNPIISQQPRRWLDRRVHVYLHVVDSTGTLNTKDEAELVFEGRIDAISDDPETKCTQLRLRHVLVELANSSVIKNPYGAFCSEGIHIPTGAVFKLKECRGGTYTNATDLTVVSAGAAGTNQINTGRFTLEEICAFMNSWLGGEKAAARINGRYNWSSPFTTNDGVRTICDLCITDGSSTTQVWAEFTMPAGVAGMLGVYRFDGIAVGGSSLVVAGLYTANREVRFVGRYTPFRTVVFSKGGPGGTLPTFQIEVENERGEFIDTYDLMPSIIKPGLSSSLTWGLFLVDEKLLIQASYLDGVLSNCFITPLGQSSPGDSNSDEPFYKLGRRADDDSGPVSVRQVFDLEGSFEQLMNVLHYNTGTPGFNHADYDTRANGLGVGLAGGLLGDAFERSIKNLPNSQTTMRLRFDEPTTLKALIGDELLARRAFPVWKNGGIVYQQWHTPVVSLASFELTEDNKARPANSQENPLAATLETGQYARPVVKFDFNPDFSFGRETRYRASMQLEDQVAVDDGSSTPSLMTVKLRCTTNQEDALALQSGYLATMPMTSRPSKFLNRSLSPVHFFGIAPGDMCLVTDRFARDPLTGLRYNPQTQAGGLDGRPAVVMRHSFDLGGAVPGRATEEPRRPAGDVDVNFFDVNRGSAYGPSADIDDTYSSGGFTNGYLNAGPTIRVKQHVYSEASEAVDAASFAAGYAIVIVEKDPTNPASPVTWTRTIDDVNGDDITLTSALSAPAFDTTKKYRIAFDTYSACTTTQRDSAFQADNADEMVEDAEVPYHWCSTPEDSDYTINTDENTEFMPDLAAGDGKSLDVGHEKALVVAANNLHDHKTAHHPMFMWTQISASTVLDQFELAFVGRVYLGLDQLSNAVYRYLTLAPWFYLDNALGGTTAQIRVTISRDLPVSAIGTAAGNWSTPQFANFYSQYTWSSVSTTPAMGTPATLEVSVKDLSWGMAYITVEAKNAYCHGLIQCREGARVLVL